MADLGNKGKGSERTDIGLLPFALFEGMALSKLPTSHPQIANRLVDSITGRTNL